VKRKTLSALRVFCDRRKAYVRMNSIVWHCGSVLSLRACDRSCASPNATLGFFTSHSIANSWAGARARQAKAQASSLYLLAYYLGSSIAGSAGGLFWVSAGWAGVISLTGALLLAAMAIALNLNEWERA
jgi:predicted MFS family arabinose efflux permease